MPLLALSIAPRSIPAPIRHRLKAAVNPRSATSA